MSTDNKKIIEDLESIIRLMADIWPNDRDNVAIAGAKFEEVVTLLGNDSRQLQKLVDLSWEGLKHLYEKDDFYMTVKAASMQAVNTIREFIIQEGEIKVEDFERAYDTLDHALHGNKESADTVIEMDEVEELKKKADELAKAQEGETVDDFEFQEIKEATLDDLASYIISINEDLLSEEEVQHLINLIASLIKNHTEVYKEPLSKALVAVVNYQKGNITDESWLEVVSQAAESAIEVESDEEFEMYRDSEVPAEKSVQEDEPVAETTSDDGNAEQTVEPVVDASEDEQTEESVFYIPLDIELSMVGEFITECNELIEMAESALLELEEKPEDDELINTVFRCFHTIKGTSAFMGLEPITEFTHSVETVLSMVREGDLSFDQANADINFESIDIIKKLLAVVEHAQGGDPLPKPDKYDNMMSVLSKVSDDKQTPADALAEVMNIEAAPAIAEPVEAKEEMEEEAKEETPQVKNSEEPAEQKKEEPVKAEEPKAAEKPVAKPTVVEKSNAKSESESSVRVSVNRLDRLIDMVGELVIAHSVVAQDNNIPKDSELQKKVNHATKIIRELQDTSLTLRMVPLRATFHKMNRLIRDLSRKAGKPVKFTTFGEDTEIDRNMVDIINDPLIHMLRNSLDHGIEDPEERAKTGKSEMANVTLRASQEGGKVIIQIQDDGRGINKDVILKKAIEKGLVDPEKKLTENEIYNLIFLPGFSSAEKVTDLSGRGVGMDVVRRSIEQLQGKIEVSSELGKGTLISLELPFTLAITDGMLIRVGEQKFIVPTINIDTTFRPRKKDIFTVMGDAEQVMFRGNSIPVIRLHRLFGIDGANETLEDGTMLIISNNNSWYALLVDQVIGQQQLVGKSINNIAKTNHISGGAILGDGRVGLILDTSTLIEAAA